jgi:hypothetical protein
MATTFVSLRFVNRVPRNAHYAIGMTLGRFVEAEPTEEARTLSSLVFGRPYQLEVAAALAALQDSSTIERIYLKARERASAAGLDPPKEGAVRKSIARLIDAKAVDEFPGERPGSPGYFSANSGSGFWDFALDLLA